jgi:predicted nucleic acid-binding OB-fold protein
MKPLIQKEKLVEFRAQGKSFSEIAHELKISKQTAMTWARELVTEIQNAKAIEFDALVKKMSMTQEKRLQIFNTLLEKIEQEIANRDLTKVATDKLFEMLMKLNDQLERDMPNDTTFTEKAPSLEICPDQFREWSA